MAGSQLRHRLVVLDHVCGGPLVRQLTRALFQRYRDNTVARNAMWISAGQAMSIGIQAVSFILLARLLGSREYGVLAGAVSFVSLFSQYAPAGSGSVFLRYVSIDRRVAPEYLGNVVLSIAAFGAVLIVSIIIGAHFYLRSIDLGVIVIVAISDCIFRQVSMASAQIFQAFEKMKITAALATSVNASRLVTVCTLLLVLHRGTAIEWAYASGTVAGLAAIAALVLVGSQIRQIRFSGKLLRLRIGEGFGFAFAASTNSVYNDVDKTLLSHFGMNAANGVYSTAYRVIDFATTPIWSVYTSALPRMFRAGERNVNGTVPTARKLLVTGLLAGAGVAILCVICAPLLPLLAGKSFAASISAIRWLALLPVFRAFALSGGAGLTASGHQNSRSMVQFMAAGFNFGINLYLIPRYSWLGAAWASLATDALVGAGNWLLYLYRCREAQVR